jgi:hypothetical protein
MLQIGKAKDLPAPLYICVCLMLWHEGAYKEIVSTLSSGVKFNLYSCLIKHIMKTYGGLVHAV